MTAPAPFEWPREWYRFGQTTFRIQPRSMVTPRTYVAGKSVYGPHAAVWVAQMALVTQRQTVGDGQAMAAFFSRLDGQAGLMRIGDYQRLAPLINRRTALAPSDTAFFADGKGFIERPVPPFGVITKACAAGEKFIEIGGLPASQIALLNRGDLCELRVNGIATSRSNLYEIQVPGNTDSAGKTGVEIRPGLREGFAVGDMVVFDHPMATMQLVDDDQGAAQISHPGQVSMGFSLVEVVG